MPDQPANTNYLRALGVLYSAMLAGQIIFALLTFGLITVGSLISSAPELENIFYILVPAFIIAGRLSGTVIYKKKVQQALNSNTITEKLSLYRSAFITRCALLEAGVFFAIITYFVTGKIALLGFAAGGILLFVMLKPTKDKVVNALQLSPGDIE